MEKNEVTNISLRECKTKKKREGGVCDGQNGSQNYRFDKCYDTCFNNFCNKHSHMQKNRF